MATPSTFANSPRQGEPRLRVPILDRWSDGAGFVFFAGLAVWTVSRMPAVGIFLLPTLVNELFVAVAFLLRDRPSAAHPSAVARAAAYAGTFLIFGFFHAARSWTPEWLTLNAMKSAFWPFDGRLRIINEQIKPAYASLRAAQAAAEIATT